MVGNKSDLDGQRDVTFDEAKQFAEENGACRHRCIIFCWSRMKSYLNCLCWYERYRSKVLHWF